MEDNLIPDSTIDIFYKRIKSHLDNGALVSGPQVKRELDRIRELNDNKIPSKIEKLLNEIY